MNNPLPPDLQTLLAQREEYTVPTHHLLTEHPLYLTQGRDQYLYDHQGREYLDFYAGIATVSVGHCNAAVNDAVVAQMKQLQHTSTLFLTKPMFDLAEKLAEISPGALKKSVLVNSGSEANEAAVLLARYHTQNYELLALRHGYHGRSYLTASLTGMASRHLESPSAPGIHFVANPYCYRCPFGLTYPRCEVKCATAVEEVILTQTTGKVAAMIAEPIQGVGGIIVPPAEYFQVLKDILDKYGILLIADEIQTGFGRTGTHWFAMEHFGVNPDIMTMAKGMANGFPGGAYIARPDVADSLTVSTIYTFGGNPMVATAALATIDYILQNRLAENAQQVGAYLKDKLLGLQEASPLLGDVRGMGLMLGLEMVKEGQQPAPKETQFMIDTCRENGLIVGKGGLHGNVIRLQPPLIVTKGDADLVVKNLEKALQAAERLAYVH